MDVGMWEGVDRLGYAWGRPVRASPVLSPGGPGSFTLHLLPALFPWQLDNLVLINKIKEQLMAEKIRPPHLPPTSVASQQPLLVPPSPAESSQSIMSLPKLQQVPGLHPQAVPQPDVALHARPATSTVTGTHTGIGGPQQHRRGLRHRGVPVLGPCCL